MVNNRPQPKGIDFTVDAEEPPTELSDAEVLHLLQREEEERPSQVLTKVCGATICCVSS